MRWVSLVVRSVELTPRSGEPEFQDAKIVSKLYEPISPRAPQPKSVHPRQTKGKISMVEGLPRGTEPEVPIETFGNRFGFFGAFNALRPVGTAGPVLDLADRPDGACPNPFAQLASRLGGLVGNGNLSGNSGLPGNFCDAPRFVNGMSEWLLAENMFAFFHGRG